MPYVEKRTVYGINNEYVDIERYRITKQQAFARKLPRPKIAESLEKQKRMNIKNSIIKLTRLMQSNFKHNKDLFVTLTFNKKVDEKTANKERKSFFSRLKYYLRKNKLPELKYIYCVGEDKKHGIHFHMCLNRISLDELEKIWKVSPLAGRPHVSTLGYDCETGLKALATYFVENVLRMQKSVLNNTTDINEHKKLIKKWSGSRNLKKPFVPKGYPKIIKSLKIKDKPNEFKLYKILSAKTVYTEYDVFQKIQLIKIRK